MNKNALFIIAALLILAFYYVRLPNASPEITGTPISDTVVKEDAMENSSIPKYVGNLEDVTENNAYGVATAMYSEEEGYSVSAIFGELPALEEGFFYEGWVVLRNNAGVEAVSTGELELDTNGDYMNVYTSDDDLTDHDFYVLTLEPDDGDPAPAAHILEGVMELQ